MKHGRSFSWLIVFTALLVLGNMGCTAQSRKNATAAPDNEKHIAQECRRVANEAIRLRNGAVSAYNSGRHDAALALFDQSLDAWRQIIDGALHCDRDAVTSATEFFDKTTRERDDMGRLR